MNWFRSSSIGSGGRAPPMRNDLSYFFLRRYRVKRPELPGGNILLKKLQKNLKIFSMIGDE